MLSKKVLKDIQSLGLKKFREETGLYVAEGPKIVDELLQLAPDKVEAVYATAGWKPTAADVPVTEVLPAELERMSQLKTPHRVIAVLRQFGASEPGAEGFSLYLDTIQDPGNFGTIVRIADWFGIRNVVCSAGCADLYNPKVVQATMASIARVNVYYDESETWLFRQQQTVYAASLHGTALHDFEKTASGVLIIGNESKGIRPKFLERADFLVTISRRGGAESLNAAVAAGIVLSHLTA